jgi:uncharacterized SAM-binding protein YcdF (DUF218 family)
MIDGEYAPVTRPVEAIAPKTPRRFLRPWRLLRMGAVALIVILVAGFFAFAAHVTSLKQPANTPKADAIVVLTGGQDRLAPAINLLLNGAAKKLLIAGVNPDTQKRDITSAYSVPRGIADCCIELDQVSTNTIGNARETAKWLRSNGFGTVILVTSNYHMPRAKLELARLGGTLDIEPYPLVASDLTAARWAEKPDAARLLITEYLKFCFVMARHWLEPAPHPGNLASIGG